MSYYWFSRQELLQKAKYGYHSCGGKEKAGKYYIKNKGVLIESVRNKHRNLSKEKKSKKRI